MDSGVTTQGSVLSKGLIMDSKELVKFEKLLDTIIIVLILVLVLFLCI